MKSKAETAIWIRNGIFDRGWWTEFSGSNIHNKNADQTYGRYLTNVQEYTSRDLRFDEDSLNAFHSVLTQFSKDRQALDHVWGLAYPRRSKSIEGLVQSLAWSHYFGFQRPGRQPRRRPQFPSWTWAGWEGKIEYTSEASTYVEVRDLQFRNTSGKLIDFEAVQTEKIPPAIHTTKIVRISHDAFHPMFNSRFPWILEQTKARLSWSYDSQSDAELLRSFQDKNSWQFAFLGGSIIESFVMILKSCPERKTWQRAGMFIFSMDVDRFKRRLRGISYTFDVE